MTNVAVAGAAGRMGVRIINLISQNDGLLLAGALERPGHPRLGEDAGLVAGLGQTGIVISSSLEDVIDRADVLIDFTEAGATVQNARIVSSLNKSMVIGTTGITDEMHIEIEALCQDMRCVMAPNMSVGVNVMFKIAGEMARILGNDYDLEVIEAHHRFKKDAPSGTAVYLGRLLSEAVGRDFDEVAVFERNGITGQRSEREIGLQSVRAGDITGDHTVIFGGIGERLELIHRAHNRDNFAKGALRAAEWVVSQPNGLYSMQDVLGLK